MVIKIEYKLSTILKERNLTISTAESCTGGLIAHRLTNIPGSSAYLMGGIVAYSNEVKQHILNVKAQTLLDYGAVSEQTAGEMALGARALLRTDYTLSVTGIAGPGGGTETKPVGLTYIGLAGPDDLLMVRRFVWESDRESNKSASADAAFQFILDVLG